MRTPHRLHNYKGMAVRIHEEGHEEAKELVVAVEVRVAGGGGGGGGGADV